MTVEQPKTRDPNQRSPLGRARGLGSAKNGTGHFVAQRWTAVALVPLILWFVVGLIGHIGASYSQAMAWVGNPINAILLTLMIVALFHHAQLGMQVVIEDYIHTQSIKIAAIFIVRGAAIVFGALAVFAILRISLGGLA